MSADERDEAIWLAYLTTPCGRTCWGWWEETGAVVCECGRVLFDITYLEPVERAA